MRCENSQKKKRSGKIREVGLEKLGNREKDDEQERKHLE